MEENGLAAILTNKRLTGVAPEVNLWQVQIRLPTLALKPRGDVTIGPKHRHQWPLQNLKKTSTCYECEKIDKEQKRPVFTSYENDSEFNQTCATKKQNKNLLPRSE